MAQARVGRGVRVARNARLFTSTPPTLDVSGAAAAAHVRSATVSNGAFSALFVTFVFPSAVLPKAVLTSLGGRRDDPIS